MSKSTSKKKKKDLRSPGKSEKKSKKTGKKTGGDTAVAKARKLQPDFDEKTSLDTVYLVNGSDTAVTLELILGAPGQTGTTDIILDTTNIITGEKGSLPEFALGTNKKLSGSTMQITTVVSDTAKDTNYLEAIIRIRGGVRFAEYVLYKTVEQEGGFAIFTARIEFFKI